jgi:hypothetical protein
MSTARDVASVMMMPATLMTTTTRLIHDRSFTVINVLDFLFYTLCFYGVLSVFGPNKQKP